VVSVIYKLIQKGIDDTSNAIRGKNIYYKCTICGDTIYSLVKDNIGCKCGNIFIDYDYFRLSVKDVKNIEILKKQSRK